MPSTVCANFAKTFPAPSLHCTTRKLNPPTLIAQWFAQREPLKGSDKEKSGIVLNSHTGASIADDKRLQKVRIFLQMLLARQRLDRMYAEWLLSSHDSLCITQYGFSYFTSPSARMHIFTANRNWFCWLVSRQNLVVFRR